MNVLKLAISTLTLAFSFTAAATNQPPGFDQAKWDSLVERIVNTGDTMTLNAGELRYLSNVYPTDTSKDHSASYFSVLGNYNRAGAYVVQDVSAVYEDWKLNADGNWVIDQWLSHMSVAGDLLSMEHRQLVEKDGRVLENNDLDAGSPTDAANLERMALWIANWTSTP